MAPSNGDNRDAQAVESVAVIRNAWKSYNGKDFILQDLSMLIPKGAIYSILGASGGGKTTLLKCLTGLMSLDAGSIQVNISSRLQIGYMPQELALYGELTIEETFNVFGMVLHMSKSKIRSRTKELVKLLELPSPTSQICNMSGGQQRKVSIAVAMMNDPLFLILDEPTVSLDTILKQSIWNYLEKITKEGRTVLLTTHYIEEAKKSDSVAFINNGYILQEGNPQDILSSSQCESLEQVYFNLCHQQVNSSSERLFPKESASSSELYKGFSKFSSVRMLALCLKTIYYIRRNLLLFYVIILSPAIMELMITEIYKRPRYLPISYINMESDCHTTMMNCTTPLSCRYLNKLRENDLNMIRMNSLKEGKRAVKDNRVWGVVNFNSNFSEGVINRLEYFFAADHVEVSDEDEARVWLDMSLYPIGYMLKRTFYDSYLQSIEDWYNDCGWNTRAALPLLRLEKPVYGRIDDSFVTSLAPGTVIMFMFSSSCSLALILILSEKELGTFERCRVSGMTMTELLTSEYLFCFATMVPTGAAQLVTLYYSAPYNGPVLWTVLLVYIVAGMGILFGLIIALLTNSMSVALLVTISLMNMFYYIAGALWPLEGSHIITKVLYYLLPSNRQIGSILVMGNRGKSISDTNVYMGFINSVVWIAILLAVIAYIVRRINKK